MAIQIYKKQSGALRVSNPQKGNVSSAIGLQANQQAQNISQIASAGQELLKIAAAQNKKHQEADAFAAYNQLQKDVIEFESAYASTHQGKDASNAAADYQIFIDTRVKELGEGLGDYAKESFSQRASGIALNAFASGTKYARQQSDVYDSDVYKGMVATHQQLVAQDPDNYAAIAMSRDQINQAQKTLFPGRDYVAMNAELDKKDASQLINSALASGDYTKAGQLFTELSPKLGSDGPALQKSIESLKLTHETRVAVATEKAKKAQVEAQTATMYGALREAIKDLPSAQQDMLAAKWIGELEDPSLRASLTTFYKKDKELLQIEQDGTDESERNSILNDKELSPSQKIFAIEKNAHMSQSAKEEAKKAVAGGVSVTDIDDFGAVESRIYAGDYVSEAAVRRAMSGLTISNVDQTRLISVFTTWQKDEGTNASKLMSTAISNADTNMKALGVPDDAMPAIRMAFVQYVSGAQSQGKTLTSAEMDMYLRQLCVKAATDTNSWGRNVINTVGLELANIPQEAQNQIREGLIANGYNDPTPAMIVQEWNRPDNTLFRGDFLIRYGSYLPEPE